MTQPFTLGVNYWPRRKAMYWWRDFDAGEVRDEFAIIRDTGLTTVRIFLLWDDWQPTPDTVSRECLDHLEKVCDAAADHGLGLDVTFFTGHMSGPNWSPGWLLNGQPPEAGARPLVSGGKIVNSGYRNYFVDEMALSAQRLLLQTVVGRFHQHPGIWLWNLGNEPDLFAIAPDRATGANWVRDMTRTIRSIDDQHPVTCGLHVASLGDSKPLRVDDTFAEVDIAVMHSYPMYVPITRHPLDPDFVPFTCALTSALCGKPTLMQEFGGCMAHPGAPSQTWKWTLMGNERTQFMASEEDMAEFLRQSLPRLVEVGALGAMVWCFADYSSELWTKPPCDQFWHERFFGLVRPDGTVKPHADVLRAFAETMPTVQPAKRTVDLGVTPDEFYEAPITHVVRLYQDWIKE
ncbi:MAG: cellulase family glycosylhydrolase [Anaerolineae bacterium]|nr:cellulase family glycosylhydrolase [Anaerolineae bacterium]